MHVNGIWIAVGREDAQLVPVGIRSITRYRVAEDNAPKRGFTPQSAMDGYRHKDPRCIYLCLFALN